MRKTFNLLSALIMLAVTAFLLSFSSFASDVVPCDNITGTNEGNHDYVNYFRWASVVKSYLYKLPNGNLMRVQSTQQGVSVLYYDSSYKLYNTINLKTELPVFGGFYGCDEGYFVLSGQNNENELSAVECFRITKYDENWNRVSSAGLYDCNTVEPFSAGTARFDRVGEYLYIRTSHKMNKSENDGKNHQANATIALDMVNMKITDSFTDVMNDRYGYVSHSFNQFIKADNGKIVAVDHGDAYPRSVVLIKYNTKADEGVVTPDYFTRCECTDLLEIPGDVGANDTGVMVGGFEISDKAYITAGNSVVLKENFNTEDTRNVFVASMDKENGKVAVNYITDYAVGDESCSNPHLVKISQNSFILMWYRSGEVFYTLLDEYGKMVGEILKFKAKLSDCVPVVYNDKLVWYTNADDKVTFYEISLQNIYETKSVTVSNGHAFEELKTENNIAYLKCNNCGETKEVNLPQNFTVYWNTDGGYSYSTYMSPSYDVGTKLYYLINFTGSDKFNEDYDVTASDGSVSLVSKNGNIGMLSLNNEGTVKLTFTHKYSKKMSRSFTVKIAHNYKEEQRVAPTCDKDGYVILKCACGAENKNVLPKGHIEEKLAAVASTCTQTGKTEGKKCSVCGTITVAQKTVAKKAHTYKTTTAKATLKANGKVVT